MKQEKPLNRNEIISASEIGQYTYCSISWYLYRCGYESISPSLEFGKKTHVYLGNTIDNIEYEIKNSRWFAVIGYLLLVAAIIFIIYGAI